MIQVSRPYLKKGERILIIDDFLGQGEAVRGWFSSGGKRAQSRWESVR